MNRKTVAAHGSEIIYQFSHAVVARHPHSEIQRCVHMSLSLMGVAHRRENAHFTIQKVAQSNNKKAPTEPPPIFPNTM